MTHIDFSRVASVYHKYIKLVNEPDLDVAYTHIPSDTVNFLQSIPGEKWDYRYAEGKWTIKEVVQHLIDADRIFCYRALMVARKYPQILTGFDQEAFVQVSGASLRSKNDLVTELKDVLQSSAILFASFHEEQLQENGSANGFNLYVKAVGYIMLGHLIHHCNVLQEKYLSKL